MPELPEVESVRRQLAPVLEGRTLERVEIFDGRLTRPFDPDRVARALEGERVVALERRGKYLLVRFGSGRALLIHLRMTGSLRYRPADGRRSAGGPVGQADSLQLSSNSTGPLPDDPHRRAVVRLDDGSDVAYRDVRRFGTWMLLEADEVAPYLDARVGREPLGRSLRARDLAARLDHRRAPVKAAILDQRTLAGVGNIYADEALWRARIHPLREARSLDELEVRALHRSIRRALARGIARHGSTLRDYALPDGGAGEMQTEFTVYGRTGEPCSRCGTPIEKIRVAGRGTWYCPACQTAPAEEPQAASNSSSRPSRSRRRSSA